MGSRCLLTLLLGIICGQLFILAVSGAEDNSATILSPKSPAKPVESQLICNCTYTVSPFCRKNSTCNANEVAQVLRKRAQFMKEIIEKANKSPDDETNNQAREDICQTLRDPAIIDYVLLEFLDEKSWTPACVSFDHNETICSLAPSLDPIGKISTREQNEFKSTLYNDKLHCGEPSYAEATHSSSYCRDKSFCHDENFFNGANKHKEEFFLLAIILCLLLNHLTAQL